MLSVEPLIVDDLHAVCRVQVNTRLGHQGHNNWIDPNVLTKGLDYPSQSVNYSVFDPLSTFTGLPEYVQVRYLKSETAYAARGPTDRPSRSWRATHFNQFPWRAAVTTTWPLRRLLSFFFPGAADRTKSN
jgi:hypothetical protein